MSTKAHKPTQEQIEHVEEIAAHFRCDYSEAAVLFTNEDPACLIPDNVDRDELYVALLTHFSEQ